MRFTKGLYQELYSVSGSQLGQTLPCADAQRWVGCRSESKQPSAGLEPNYQRKKRWERSRFRTSSPIETKTKQANACPNVVTTNSLSQRFVPEGATHFMKLSRPSSVAPHHRGLMGPVAISCSLNAELLCIPQSPAEKPPPPKGPSGYPEYTLWPALLLS